MDSITFQDFHLVYLSESIENRLWPGYYIYMFKTKSWYKLNLNGARFWRLRGKRQREILNKIIEEGE